MDIEEWINLNLESFRKLGYIVVSNNSEDLSSGFEKRLNELRIDFYVEHDFDYMTFYLK